MENKITIIFYNNYHIGDLFLAQPFVKNIVDNNSDKFNYYFYSHYGDFIYTSVIPNIKNIKHEIEFNELSSSMDKYNFENFVYLKDKNILLINTWIGCMSYTWNKKQSILDDYKDYLKECSLISYIKVYEVTISAIKREHNIEIIFSSDIQSSYPIFPDLNIDYFNDFKERNNDRKIVFLNNYRACSGQTTSIRESWEFINLIHFFIKKDYIVLLPENDSEILRYKNECNINNLYFMLDIFPIVQDTSSSSSLYYLAKIGNQCDISVFFDTGRNFLYMNKSFIDEFKNGVSKNKKFHFGVSIYSFYFNNLNNNQVVPENYVAYVNANNHQDIINYFSANI